MLLISAPLILVPHAQHARIRMVGLFPHTWLIGDQSQGKATQRRTSPPSLLNLNLNLLVSPDRPPSLGDDPRNFTLAHSPFLATVDLPSLAAGANSANDLCPPSPPVLQFCLKSPKPRGLPQASQLPPQISLLKHRALALKTTEKTKFWATSAAPRPLAMDLKRSPQAELRSAGNQPEESDEDGYSEDGYSGSENRPHKRQKRPMSVS